MSDAKKANFFQRTKSAMSEVGAKAGKAIQSAKEASLPAAGKLAGKIVDATKSAAGTVGEKINDAFEAVKPRNGEQLTIIKLPDTDIRLLLPNGYKRCRNSQSLLDAVKGRGNEEVSYQKKTESFENMLTIRKIAPHEAMPVDDVPGLIGKIRQSLSDNQGIIEVKAGKRADGCRYVYCIVKERSSAELGSVTYHLRLHLFSDANVVELDARFREIGVAGNRDCICAVLADKAGLIDMVEDVRQGWSADPYDPGYTKGFLKNLSEKEGLDALFPEHPLAQARELLLAALENRLVKVRRDENEGDQSHASGRGDEQKGDEQKSEEQKGDDQKGEETPASDNGDEREEEVALLRSLFTDQCRRITYDVDIDPKADAKKAQEEQAVIARISTRSAIKIFYYLMAADGEVYHSEEEKFDAICAELDPDFAEHKGQIVEECQAQMGKAGDSENYFDVLLHGVETALASSVQTADTFITPKLLLWDLLTVAYSDESCDAAERQLLEYIVKKLNIDEAIFPEMESSILTLMDLEKELSWIKTTDRPYLTIEAMVNEIADRKNVVFESVKALIAL